MKRRMISLALACLMMVMAFAACTSSPESGTSAPPPPTSNDNQTAAPPPATPEPGAPPVEISMLVNINAEIVLENNPAIQYIEQKLNIKLNIEAPPQDSFWDRAKLLMATGEMPDLLHYGANAENVGWAEEGLLLDVTDLIANYPNLSKNISMEQYGDCVFLSDGRIYGVPKPNSFDVWGFLINKKWLDNLNLQAPRTVDEFVEVCRAFTFDDPDGNGANDTFGVSFGADAASMDSGIWHLRNDFLSTAYSISAWHRGLPDADGSAKLRPLYSQYGEYMQLLNKLYADGIVDRDFITHKAEECVEKFAQQRVGIVGCSGTNYIPNIIERYNLNPDDYVYCAPLVKTAGQKGVYACPPSNWMAYYVNAKSSPEKQDAALRLLDFANSEEGFVLFQFGIAGVDYNAYDVQARTIDRTEDQIQAVQKVTGNNFAMANALNGQAPLLGGSSPAAIAKWQAETGAADKVTQRCYFGFTKMLDPLNADFPDEVQTLNSLEARYVTGEVPFDELINYVNGTYKEKTAGYAQALQDYMTAHPARYVD